MLGELILHRIPSRFGTPGILRPESCGWSAVGVGTSDFLGLGPLGVSFASSHPVPFTPGLFYCFITFLRALVAKSLMGYSQLSHFTKPQVLLF